MSRSHAERRVREAVAAAAVGRGELFAGLEGVGGVGDVAVRDGTAYVEVTLPVPAESVRESIERDLEAALADIGDVSDVEVRWRPVAPDRGERVDFLPGVKNVVAVASGKGGVGKSTVAVNVAAALADAGASVGLLDADVYGPNAPTMLGLSDSSPATTADDEMVPREAHGVRAMSMDFVVDEDDPVIWRGPMVDDVLKQLFDDVTWGELDYLIVDMPPGTGDAQLTLAQHLPVAGAVIVTTPQPVAVDDARLGLKGFARYDVPILGIAENMARFSCPDCGGSHRIFGEGGADGLAAEFDVPVLGSVPLDPDVGRFESEAVDPPGVSIPLVGRLELPRTREEREEGAALPPAAVRDAGGEARTAFREIATRTAARLGAFAAR